MLKDKTSSWKNVFSFTFMQQVKGKSYKIATILIGLIVFIIVLATMLITGLENEELDEVIEIHNIEKVYILDTTEEFSDMDLFIDSYSNKAEIIPSFEDISFTQVASDSDLEKIMEEVSKDDKTLLLNIERQEDGLMLKGILPEETFIDVEESEDLLDILVPILETYKITNSGLSQEQLISISKPMISTVAIVGEEPIGIAEQFVTKFVPYLFATILYIILLIYGQTVINSLLIEKTSKLMEMLLTSVRPKKVVAGKIVATTIAAVLQFVSWLVSAVLGFVVGILVVRSQNAAYVNPVSQAIDLVKDNSEGYGFSGTSILLSLVALSLGFLFYFSIAGIIGSMLGKAEDISNGVGLFTIPVVIFALMSMMVHLLSEGFWPRFMNYFPLTSPFILPANIFTGNVGIIASIIGILILMASIAINFILAGKLFKGLIFYKGEKLSFKNIALALKGE